MYAPLTKFSVVLGQIHAGIRFEKVQSREMISSD